MKTHDLLSDLISEKVTITTDLTQAVVLESGEMAEVPMIVEGEFVDYDDDFLLVSEKEGSPPLLIRKDHVIMVKVVDAFEEVMADPSRPELGDMN